MQGQIEKLFKDNRQMPGMEQRSCRHNHLPCEKACCHQLELIVHNLSLKYLQPLLNITKGFICRPPDKCFVPLSIETNDTYSSTSPYHIHANDQAIVEVA